MPYWWETNPFEDAMSPKIYKYNHKLTQGCQILPKLYCDGGHHIIIRWKTPTTAEGYFRYATWKVGPRFKLHWEHDPRLVVRTVIIPKGSKSVSLTKFSEDFALMFKDELEADFFAPGATEAVLHSI